MSQRTLYKCDNCEKEKFNPINWENHIQFRNKSVCLDFPFGEMLASVYDFCSKKCKYKWFLKTYGKEKGDNMIKKDKEL